ncbi:helix-turn-helix domain-containing protein [Blautia sp. AF19-10LB]|uniref:helix-turn-helix domain-containing protein n=1 Tax=Blautia sp. AF19-10LB TaxID=2292961 RepID=UPI003FA4B2BD
MLFVLRLLRKYFASLGSIEQLCEHFGISQNLFYKWLKLWNSHKQRWLGVLDDSETQHSYIITCNGEKDGCR